MVNDSRKRAEAQRGRTISPDGAEAQRGKGISRKGAEARRGRTLQGGLVVGVLASVFCLLPAAFGQSVASIQANRDNIRYADAFPGTDACARIQNAINDLPDSGGMVIANFQGTQTCSTSDGSTPPGAFTVGTLPYNGPASAPTLSYVAGGTLAAATYYVKATWVDSAGESLASPEASLAVPADNLLVVDSPPSGGALSDRGWNVYVSTASGTETLQNQGASSILQGSSNWAPLAIGTNWSEATTGITANGIKVTDAGTDNKPVALKLGAETLIVAAPITVYDSSSITGIPEGINSWVPNTSVVMAQAGANLPEVIDVNGTQDNGEQNQALRYLTVDGNNQSGAEIGILLNSVGSFLLNAVTVKQAAGPGIEVESSCCALMQNLFLIGNQGDGLYASGSSDIFINSSQFEANGSNGVELANSPTFRIEHDDIGGNSKVGIYETCTGTSPFSCGRQIIVGNQFGNNAQGDIKFVGYNNNASDSLSWIIDGNAFIARPISETGYPEIDIQDSGYNTITGNMFDCGSQITYAVNIHQLNTTESPDTVAGNTIFGTCATAQAEGTSSTVWVGNANFGSLDTAYPNNQPINALNTSNTPVGLLELNSSNNVEVDVTGTGATNINSKLGVGPSIQSGAPFGNDLYVEDPGSATVMLDSLGTSSTASITLQPRNSSGNPTPASWTVGTAAPTGSCTTGSLYSNTGGSSGSTLYACVSGSWADVK